MFAYNFIISLNLQKYGKKGSDDEKFILTLMSTCHV